MNAPASWETRDGQWWAREKGDATLADEIVTVASHIERQGSERRANNLVFCRLFSGRAIPSIYGMAMSTSAESTMYDFSGFTAPSFNLVGSCVETLNSKVGRNEPWILFLTDGGNFKSRFAGRRLSDYVTGLFYEEQVYRHGRMAFQDALIFGSGIVKVTSEKGRFVVSRVIPDELLVDEGDAVYGRPVTLYQRRFVHRERLKQLYGGRSADIDAAIEKADGAEQGVWSYSALRRANMIPIVEAWHLADEDGKGGRHVVAVPGATLIDEKWSRTTFPFAVLRYNELQSGWWGQGIGEILTPMQAEFDRTHAVIRDAQSRVGRPWLAVPKTGDGKAGLNVRHLTARGVANVVEHMPGAAPAVLTFPSVANDIYQERDRWKEWAFQRVGISQISASGMKQPGLSSGEALRAQHDFESERFVTLARDYERFYVDIARLLVEEAKAIKPKVTIPGRGHVEVMPWSDVELDFTKSQFVPMAFPLSSLPTSPAGRLARADEMLERGQISKIEHARILGYPDTTATTDLVAAPREVVDKILDEMIEKGDEGYRTPEPALPLELCIQVASARYCQELLRDVPDDRLDLIQRWLMEAKQLSKRIAASEAPPPQPQPEEPPQQQGGVSSAGSAEAPVNPLIPSQTPDVPVLDAMPASA